MKFNKWTLGLAAVGVVSLASVAQAEEKMNVVQTTLAGTTIGGYVDTSAQWNIGTGNLYVPPYKFGGSAKADGFNLNVVQISISRPLDESQWAAGYKVDMWFGPDADALGTRTMSNYGGYLAAPNFAIRQAYVALRVPVGNGIDFKVGVFDSVIGYESVESGNNPNFTRSYGHGIEPQTMTGVLATYRFSDCVAASAGVANTVGPEINQRAFPTYLRNYDYDSFTSDGMMAESYKTYMGSIALTAPQDWGWIAGSTLYGGVVNGFNESENPYGNYSNIEEPTTSWYAGVTLATPVTGLKLGAAFDYLHIWNWSKCWNYAWAVAGYASYQATEKLSLHVRGEYFDDKTGEFTTGYGWRHNLFALTGTAQYDLWQNVISRLEFRWDHSTDGWNQFGAGTYHTDGMTPASGYLGCPSRKNAFVLVANFIYKF